MKQCIYATKSCPFHEIGCIETELPQFALSQHNKQQHIVHTELLLKQLLLTKQENMGLKAKLNQSQQISYGYNRN